MLKKLVVALLCIVSANAFAMIDLELTEGVAASIPLAIPDFTGVNAIAPGNQTLAQIVENDLQNSGEFRVVNQGVNSGSGTVQQWKKLGADYMLSGSVLQLGGGQYQVHFSLHSLVDHKDAASQQPLLDGDFTASAESLRQLGHQISDEVYAKLTGVRGIFNTKIAYVLVQHLPRGKTRYQLEVADEDGFNPQTLLRSNDPIMSPAWSPDGAQLAYVSFEGEHAAIYLQDLKTAKRELVSRAPGINGAPAFSPDGQKLALVLSKTGNPKIYVLDLKTHKLQQITFGWSIDTEPAFSVDGSSLLFTSNRDGSPQIYQYSFPTSSTLRVTYDGNYNARASFTPNGQAIVLMHRDKNEFGIARLDMSSGQTQTLVSSGSDESPSIAPNGKMIIYATHYAGRGVLAQVSTDGRIKLRLPAQEGTVQEPAWSPFIK